MCSFVLHLNNKQRQRNFFKKLLNFTSFLGLHQLSLGLYSLFPFFLFPILYWISTNRLSLSPHNQNGSSQGHWWLPIKDFHGYFSVLFCLIYYHLLTYLWFWRNYTLLVSLLSQRIIILMHLNWFLLVSQSQCLGLLGISIWTFFLF